MMGTVGVVNLITSSAAQKAGQVTGPQEIIAPLAGKKGATSKLGSGTGVVQAEVKGHYLILMWAQFADLKSPSTLGRSGRHSSSSPTNLVTGSANINLSTRMLTGKPQLTGRQPPVALTGALSASLARRPEWHERQGYIWPASKAPPEASGR